MRNLLSIAAALLLTACASRLPEAPSGAAATAAPAAAGQDKQIQMSPECLAANLRPADALPVGLIPDDVLRKAQSGWVSVRYDVVAGKARNAVVVASEPPGLYDIYALKHANAYTEPTGANVRGCIMTTNIKF